MIRCIYMIRWPYNTWLIDLQSLVDKGFLCRSSSTSLLEYDLEEAQMGKHTSPVLMEPKEILMNKSRCIFLNLSSIRFWTFPILLKVLTVQRTKALSVYLTRSVTLIQSDWYYLLFCTLFNTITSYLNSSGWVCYSSCVIIGFLQCEQFNTVDFCRIAMLC